MNPQPPNGNAKRGQQEATLLTQETRGHDLEPAHGQAYFVMYAV